MKSQTTSIEKMIINEWNELGFYYDCDDRLSVNQWRFFGSRKGLYNFALLLDEYINNPQNSIVGEHEHYGPYCYLKIMTWDSPQITEKCITGTIEDLKNLKTVISEKILQSQAGDTFNIDKDYGVNNTITAKFFVMKDDFEPFSMDELIVSGRQEIVNTILSGNSNTGVSASPENHNE